MHRIDLDDDTCRKLVKAFYARVERDPVLRPLYPPTLEGCPIDNLSDFLIQFLGGPCVYAPHRWSLSLREAHFRFKIGQRERDAWLDNMFGAIDDTNIQEPMRGALRWCFEQASTYLINHQQAGADELTPFPKYSVEGQQELPSDDVHQNIAQRWHMQQALEETIAAVRKGDPDRALRLIESPLLQVYFDRDQAAFLSLLAIFSGNAHPVLLHYVSQKLLNSPELVQQRYTYGCTLLHEVASNGSLTIVELLLRLGANPAAEDQYGHTPLYRVGNECNRESGGDIVHKLVQAGANVGATERLKRCTALHMAARRGNVRVAAALLDCKANIEARDKLGDTPLRRAVNCGKTEMVAFLLSQGADANSRGSRGLAPWQVARGAAMKQLLQPYSE